MACDSQSYHGLPLLPYRFRFVGYCLILLSFGAAYLYFWGGRPQVFEIPVFAIATSYAETRWFVMARTNLLDEISLISSVLGFLFIGFSKEQKESKGLQELRSRALLYSVYTASGIWIFLYLSVFGWPMIVLSATIFLLFLVSYILLFQLLRRKLNVGSIKKSNTKTSKSEVQ